jgi:UPF0716 protein FxsA
MLPLLLVLFIALPIIELAAILQVGSWIGFWPTLGILVVDSIIGSVLMRTQSRAVWRRFNAALAEGRPPAKEVIDGVLVIAGGVALLTPGFVTDIFGALFLLPPTRAVLRRLLVRRVAQRMVVSMASAMPFGGAGFGRAPRDFDVDGTAHEVPRTRPRLP